MKATRSLLDVYQCWQRSSDCILALISNPNNTGIWAIAFPENQLWSKLEMKHTITRDPTLSNSVLQELFSVVALILNRRLATGQQPIQGPHPPSHPKGRPCIRQPPTNDNCAWVPESWFLDPEISKIGKQRRAKVRRPWGYFVAPCWWCCSGKQGSTLVSKARYYQ